MPYERTGYAPWSLTREAGVQSATVDGTIQVPQYIQPVLTTGFVDKKGNWIGTESNDTEFINFQIDEAIADNAETLSAKTIDMFNHDILMFALKVSRTGNYNLKLIVSGTETGNDSYFNLKPAFTNLAARATMRTDSSTDAFDKVLDDQEAIADAGTWHVFKINDCRGFKLVMQVVNQSGGNSNIEQAIMRII